MDRLACVELPQLPLQLLLRQHPDWRSHPVAVVDDDRPQGTILTVNERARAARVLPGMRYAAGLSLQGSLRASVVSPSAVDEAVRTVRHRLDRFTPFVEPAEDEPDVFWLDASGLDRIYDSLKSWAHELRDDLGVVGFRAHVMVGFDRFATYALARSKRGVVVFRDAADERHAARRVPLERLPFETRHREAFSKLGVRTVGAFVDLPPDGIRRRFGPVAWRLYRLAHGELEQPLAPKPLDLPAQRRIALDQPEVDVERLLRRIEVELERLVAAVARKGRALAGVHVGFGFERLSDHVEQVRPASPTRDLGQLMELIRLRLCGLEQLPDGVVDVRLVADEVAAIRRQSSLFPDNRRRETAAAERALARVRAELGDDAVVRPQLKEGHLPEAGFGWRPVESLKRPRPAPYDDRMTLIRRIHAKAVPLPSRPRQEPDGWMLRGLEQGPVIRVAGPYVVSGGWWRRAVHREYHFAETQKGELLWVFYDRLRRRWFLQGRVE